MVKVSTKSHFHHDCELSPELRQFHIYSPYDRWYHVFWHNLRDNLTVCKNFQSSQYFRSMASLAKEKKRHLLNRRYRFVIHPFSIFAQRKSFVLVFIWLGLITVESYMGSFFAKEFLGHVYRNPAIEIPLLLINLLLVFDIFCRFFTGFALEETRIVILDPRRAAKTYLQTYFFFDFGAIVGYVFFYFLPFWTLKSRLIIYQLHKLRLFRMKTIWESLDDLMIYFNLQQSWRLIVHFSIICFVILHECSCLIGLIHELRSAFDIPLNQTWYHQYMEHQKRITSLDPIKHEYMTMAMKISTSFNLYTLCLSIVMCHFFGCGTYHYKIKGAAEMTLMSLILVSGLMFYVYAVARVLQIFGMVNVSEIKYDELMLQVEHYNIKKNFPNEMTKRINAYYNYKYDKKFFSEQRILNMLSEHLRMEVLLYSCQNLIGEVKIFRGLSKSAVGCILALLKQEIYVSDDIITSSEEGTGSIFFILYGTCGVELSPYGQELMHVDDGDHFGDTSEFDKRTKPEFAYSVVALEASEVYEFERKDIRYCLKTYPEIEYKLEAMAKNKAKHYNAVFAAFLDDEEHLGDAIMDELRRGRILHHGFKREDFA